MGTASPRDAVMARKRPKTTPRQAQKWPRRGQDRLKRGPRAPKRGLNGARTSSRGLREGLRKEILQGETRKCENQRFASTGARFQGGGASRFRPETGSESGLSARKPVWKEDLVEIWPDMWPDGPKSGPGRPTRAWKRGREPAEPGSPQGP